VIPAHSACLSPKTLALTTSPVSEAGDTSDAINEFDQTIECGSGYSLEGPQVYYKVDLTAGKTYTITATPGTDWDIAVYAFTDLTCTAATIETQCTALFADDKMFGDPEILTITPSASGTYVLAVDAGYVGEGGAFTLNIAWQ
jgi:hypothetical protein